MKFILNKDNLIIENAIVPHSGSVKYYEADVEMDESWQGLTVACILKKKTEKEGVAISLIDNKVFIGKELSGDYVIGFIGYLLDYILTEDTVIDKNKTYYTRTGEQGSYVYTIVENPVVADIATYYESIKTYQVTTALKYIRFVKGAGEVVSTNAEDVPSQTEWEIYIEQIQNMIDGLEGRIPTKLSELTNDNNTVQDENYVHTDNNYTTEEKTKLASLNNYDDTDIKNDITRVENEIPDVSGLQSEITSLNKLASDLIDDTNQTHKFVTTSEKAVWDAKGTYSKPTNGIPKTDLENSVQTSLGKADSAIQDISSKQDVIDSTHKLSADLIDDGETNKTVTATEKTTWTEKQDALVSGTNIKTINNESILGEGNITVSGGSSIDVHDSYNTSTTEPYSANYINNIYDFSQNGVRVGTWVNRKTAI